MEALKAKYDGKLLTTDEVARARTEIDEAIKELESTAHLEPVTNEENSRRGGNLGPNPTSRYCNFGHEYTEENTWWRYTGQYYHRVCKACKARTNRSYYVRVERPKLQAQKVFKPKKSRKSPDFTEKTCAKCNELKPKGEYYFNARWQYFYRDCKSCRRAAARVNSPVLKSIQ